mgnify:CR=1 FL=1
MNILVVDDVHENRILMKSLLKLGGYENVTTVESATKAFQHIGLESPSNAKGKVDLILMDLMMPQVDGITACRMIKSKPYLVDIPIIMVTANTDSKSLESSFASGAIDYIHKPLDKTELLARVRSVLKLKEEMDRRKAREKELWEVKHKLEEANKALRRLSARDGLTGVLNRRIFDEKIAEEWRRAPRENTVISLILLDIDYFKAYNDHYGHQAGDQCLKSVADTLNKTLMRTGDMLFRYGGEEFAAILPHTNLSGAIHVAETLRHNVETLKLPHEKSQIIDHITISIGVATMKPAKANFYSELIELADKALYKAKKTGRNRVNAIHTFPNSNHQPKIQTISIEQKVAN